MSIVWFILLALGFSAAYAACSGAPWVPTWKRDIERAKKLLDVKPGETFVELVCGDGRVTIGLTGQTGVTGVGVELSLDL